MRPWRRRPTRRWYSPSGATRPASVRPSQRNRWRRPPWSSTSAASVRTSSPSRVHDRHRHLVGAPQPESEQRGVEAAVAVGGEAAAERELLDHRRRALQPGRDEERAHRGEHERREHESRRRCSPTHPGRCRPARSRRRSRRSPRSRSRPGRSCRSRGGWRLHAPRVPGRRGTAPRSSSGRRARRCRSCPA